MLRLITLGAAATGLAACADLAGRATVASTPLPSPLSPAASSHGAGRSPLALSPGPSPADLRRKIGRMLLVGFRGLEVGPDDPVVRAIVEEGLGGVILFDLDGPTGGPRNVASPTQLGELTAALRQAASSPLLVAVDQEGGQVARLNPGNGFRATLSARQLGARGDPDFAFSHARSIARTLASVGINLNLAPVVDLDINPDNPAIGRYGRSFSADPAVVTAMALAEIRAHHDLGVLTTLKHFPGQGSATADTHVGVVDVTRTWSRDELGPFEAIIAAGQADLVMTAHLFNAHLDPAYPATLSRKTVAGLLRGELGWTGVVVSDDLQMGAIRTQFGADEAIALAIEAGVDLLLFANQQVYEPRIATEVINTIAGLVASGQISEARIDESVSRLAALSVLP